MVDKTEAVMIIFVAAVLLYFAYFTAKGWYEAEAERRQYPSVLDYDCEKLEEKVEKCFNLNSYTCVTMYSNLMILKGCKV